LEADALQIATESFAAIRTVISFNARAREVERFRVVTDRRRRFGEQAAHASGMSWAFGQASIFFSYALGFWYGSTLVADGIMSPGDVLTVFFMIIFTGMSIGQAMSALPDLARASGSALDTFRIIDRTPLLDPKDGTGIRDRPIRGDISIENLTLEYPTRPGVQVLKNLSLRIPHGQVTALVGGSGSGKTSIISVLERFYDPVAGRVILDGADLRDYDLHWLRGRISLVAQEPILFSCSIMENIRHAKPDATEEEVFHAAKMANAHDFITKLPKGYKTLVGERGGMLSGGQKQRVAIARAVLKNPAILLLDEATSALDTESERLVQEALYSLMADRTSIVVAHRLSTIQNAQQIVVIGGGSVLEAGRHEELTSRKSFYAQLFQRQMVAADTLLSQPVPPPAPLAPTIEPVGKGKEPI
jgi:ABC-type multidrug transport system fused ATPase/permease subunit